MNAELMTHSSLTQPAYRIARPGILCRATRLPAVSCQALSPGLSQFVVIFEDILEVLRRKFSDGWERGARRFYGQF